MDEADRRAFLAELQERRLLTEDTYVIPREWPADLRARASQTWDLVFALGRQDEMDPRKAQAAIESLRPRDVVGAVVGPEESTDEWWAAYEELAPDHVGLTATYRDRLRSFPPGSLGGTRR